MARTAFALARRRVLGLVARLPDRAGRTRALIAFALVLGAASAQVRVASAQNASPQDDQARSADAQDVPTQNERFAAVQEDGAGLDALVLEFDARATATAELPDALLVVYLRAARANIATSAASPGDLDALHVRVERARRLALRTARPERIGGVEEDYGRRLLELGHPREALAVFRGGVAKVPADSRYAPGLWLRTAETEHALGGGAEANAAAQRAETACAQVFAEPGAELTAEWRAILAWVQLDAVELQFRVALETGLPDEAARAVARHRACVETVAFDDDERDQARFQTLQLELALRLAVQDTENALSILKSMEDLEHPPSEAERVERVGRALIEGRTLPSNAPVPEALKQDLAELAADSELEPSVARAVHSLRARLALREHDLAAAEEEARAFQRIARAEEAGAAGRCAAELEFQSLLVEIELARPAEPAALAMALERLRSAFDAYVEAHARLPAPKGGTGRLYWASARQQLSTRIDAEIALAGGAETGRERAYDALLALEGLGTFVRTERAGRATLADVRTELLQGGAVLLAWIAAPDRSHVFLVDEKRVLHAPLRSRTELLNRAQRLMRALAPPRANGDARARKLDIADACREFGTAFLPPEFLTALESATGVYVTGAEFVGSPPFEALPFHATHLGLERPLAYLPSASAGVALARRARARPPASIDLAVLTEPDLAEARARFHRDFPDFALDADVLDAFEASAPGRVRVWTGRDANRARFASEEVLDAAMAIFLTHGVYDARRARPAGLAFSSAGAATGLVFGEDVDELQRTPTFAALLACGTAIGPARIGDDTSADLGSAFFARGSSVVVQSPVELAFDSTQIVAGVLAQEVLAHGAPPAEALRIARARLAATERWSDPFFHARLSAHGIALAPLPGARERAERAASAPKRARPPMEAWWGILLAGAFTVVVVVVLKRRRASGA